MANDVLEIMVGQADVQRVQHRAHAGDGVIRLQMPRAVPHERADPIANTDTGVGQGVGQLMCPVAHLARRLPANARFRGGNDF